MNDDDVVDVSLLEPEPEPKPSKPRVSASKLHEAMRAGQPYAGIDRVEQAMVREGLLASRYVSDKFGPMPKRAYRRWQRQLGFRGHDADGVPDYTSLKRLGDKHGFTVTR